jgi:hypothetical protein
MTRHHRHHADLDSPLWWLKVAAWLALAAILTAAWLLQAIIVLPAAAIAKVTRHDHAAARWARTLNWR